MHCCASLQSTEQHTPPAAMSTIAATRKYSTIRIHHIFVFATVLFLIQTAYKVMPSLAMFNVELYDNKVMEGYYNSTYQLVYFLYSNGRLPLSSQYRLLLLWWLTPHFAPSYFGILTIYDHHVNMEHRSCIAHPHNLPAAIGSYTPFFVLT
jgi:hypothetical protein